MMKKEFTKQLLSIQELSNLSEIEKGTIRIWEKRYHILKPQRTETNIRYYTLDDLKFLLNIKLLIDKEFKISKIASMTQSEIDELIHSYYHSDLSVETQVKKMLLDVLEFDKDSFEKHYAQIANSNDFKKIYVEYIIPLLHYVGMLWQTNNLDISHEHFLVEILKQKIYSEIDKTTSTSNDSNSTFVLFLPENEIHDIGLLFFHYLLLQYKMNCIMLGATIPIEALDKFIESENSVYFATHLSTSFRSAEVVDFINILLKLIESTSNKYLWITGNSIPDLKNTIKSRQVVFIENIDDLENNLNQVKNEEHQMELI